MKALLSKITSDKIILTLISIFYLYLASRVHFYQNDDWVYSENVKTMLAGSFALNWYIGPTFFAQGLLGTLFAYFFGVDRLPLLTGLISVINIWLVSYYLEKVLKTSTLVRTLTVTIIAFNPLFIYSTIGFMTEQYFLMILMLSLFLIDEYISKQNSKTLVLLILITFDGLLMRQVTLVIPLAIALYFLVQKNLKQSAICFTWFASFYYYFDHIFPQTKRMIEVPLQWHHFTNLDYTLALVIGAVIVISAFTLPFVFSYLKTKITLKNINLVVLAITTIIVAWLAYTNFKPNTISWGEFPYFENTFERTGLYPRGIHGTKYQFRMNYKLYYYWDLASKILAAPLFVYLLIKLKKNFNYYLSFALVYFGMLIATETFYDRYLLPLFLVIIFYFLSQNIQFKFVDKLTLFGFALFTTFYGYNLVMDFMLVNDFAWTTSKKIVNENKLNPNKIKGTNAWKLFNKNLNRDYDYLISYDSQDVNHELNDLYTIYAKKKIEYPMNFFINPVIYVYKLNTLEAIN